MPIKNRKVALNRFMIEFEERITNLVWDEKSALAQISKEGLSIKKAQGFPALFCLVGRHSVVSVFLVVVTRDVTTGITSIIKAAAAATVVVVIFFPVVSVLSVSIFIVVVKIDAVT